MLVGLRLSIGWHFYQEGVKKYQDREHFTSGPFLDQATGPWADYFHSQVPKFHRWDELLAVPVPYSPPTDKQLEERGDWEKERAEAEKKAAAAGEPVEIDFPPHAVYRGWAAQIVDDWRFLVQQYIIECGLDEEQKEAADRLYLQRKVQLLDYLEENSDAIVDYRHELARLAQLKQSPTADDVPYQKSRVAQKQGKTRATVDEWIRGVQEIEDALRNDLNALLTENQRPLARLVRPHDTLATIDRIVPYWHLAVGALLLVGLFSRLAGLGAAAFLMLVVATQPPWVSGAADTYYQVVELFGALVLATIPTGRWAGLDFFIHWLFTRCCRS